MGCGSGCASCGVTDGIPAGCQENGRCGTGGCNMLNSFDWLSGQKEPEGQDPFGLVEVSFKNGAEKSFCFKGKHLHVETGEMVVVSSDIGYDIGRITLSGELVRLQMKKKNVHKESDEVRSIMRKASPEELEKMATAIDKETETLIRSRAIAKQLSLEMKIGDVQYQADNKKATFFYTAEGRVDFRELIKEYAREFKVKVKMHQIGARQQAARIGGIGDCGRELCCSTWLTQFKSVVTSAARYQNLSINQSKLSGQCGRLKCCLNYELDTYMDALSAFPKDANKIDTVSEVASLHKSDIFKGLMWYSYPSERKLYPLTIDQVKEALELNSKGKKCRSLSDLQVYQVLIETENETLVGQVSLAALESKRHGGRGKRKKRNKRKRRS